MNQSISAPWGQRPRFSDITHRFVQSDDVRFVAGTPTGRRTAYGDCCMPALNHRTALDTTGWDSFLDTDWTYGRIVCRPGIPLADVIRLALPKGWFLGASPGTSRSTVGGCVACDVHGKNHHVHGSFCQWVEEIELLTGNGEVIACGPDHNDELFWATAGGLGQTGLITKVTLRLQRVPSSWMRTQTFVTENYDQTLTKIEDHPEATYSVSWIDSLARGRHFGRGVVMLGEHAVQDELPTKLRGKEAHNCNLGSHRFNLPFPPPDWASPPLLWRIFNEGYWRAAKQKAGLRFEPLFGYFYPLDGVANWNRVYGKRGFIEYQVAVPLRGGAELCKIILKRLSEKRYGSFLAVIKKFGEANPGHLSFPFPGYTLAVDMGFAGEPQEKVLRRLDELVAGAGGRVYLVKDSRLQPDMVRAMYPRLEEWQRIVNTHDPGRKWTSHLTERLRLRDE